MHATKLMLFEDSLRLIYAYANCQRSVMQHCEWNCQTWSENL